MKRTTLLLTVVALAALVFASPALAAPGDLDPTFSEDGIVTTDFGDVGADDIREGDIAEDVVLQPDGKTVVGGITDVPSPYDYYGSKELFALMRYNADGSLDTSFDGDGKVSTDLGEANQWLNALALQPDGKIVAAGSSEGNIQNPQNGFALVRYNANGSVDTSFGGDGEVNTDFGSGTQYDNYGDYAEDVFVQPDGKIVAVGSTLCCSANAVDVFALARYNADGSLDTSFGGDGKVTTEFGGLDTRYAEIYSAALQPDGKIVVAGVEEENDGDSRFALARYNTDGSLDTSFGGGDGQVTTAFSSYFGDGAEAVALQQDGKILAAGLGGDSFALARYNANGSLDTAFSGDGKVATDFGCIGSYCGETGSRAKDIGIQQDGKIVVGGEADRGGSTAQDFALARYSAKGALDTTFSVDGKTTTNLSQDNGVSCDSGNGVALQPNGSIVVAGKACPNTSTGSDFAVVRYEGATDPASLPPSVIDTIPATGTAQVRRDISPEATFSKEMNPATLNSSTVKLQMYNKKKGKWTTIPATVSPIGGNRVILDPYGATEGSSETLLAANKKFRGVITTGAKDLAGTPLQSTFKFVFYTGSS